MADSPYTASLKAIQASRAANAAAAGPVAAPAAQALPEGIVEYGGRTYMTLQALQSSPAWVNGSYATRKQMFETWKRNHFEPLLAAQGEEKKGEAGFAAREREALKAWTQVHMREPGKQDSMFDLDLLDIAVEGAANATGGILTTAGRLTGSTGLETTGTDMQAWAKKTADETHSATTKDKDLQEQERKVKYIRDAILNDGKGTDYTPMLLALAAQYGTTIDKIPLSDPALRQITDSYQKVIGTGTMDDLGRALSDFKAQPLNKIAQAAGTLAPAAVLTAAGAATGMGVGAAGAVANAALMAGESTEDYDAVRRLPHDTLMKVPEYAAHIKAHGDTAQSRIDAADALALAAQAKGSAARAVLGGVTGWFGRTTGLDGLLQTELRRLTAGGITGQAAVDAATRKAVAELMAKGSTQKAAEAAVAKTMQSPSLIRAAWNHVAGQMAQEFPEGAGGQLTQNVLLNQLDPSQRLSEDVLYSGTSEGLAAGFNGGAALGISRMQPQVSEAQAQASVQAAMAAGQPPAAPPAAPPAPVPPGPQLGPNAGPQQPFGPNAGPQPAGPQLGPNAGPQQPMLIPIPGGGLTATTTPAGAQAPGSFTANGPLQPVGTLMGEGTPASGIQVQSSANANSFIPNAVTINPAPGLPSTGGAFDAGLQGFGAGGRSIEAGANEPFVDPNAAPRVPEVAQSPVSGFANSDVFGERDIYGRLSAPESTLRLVHGQTALSAMNDAASGDLTVDKVLSASSRPGVASVLEDLGLEQQDSTLDDAPHVVKSLALDPEQRVDLPGVVPHSMADAVLISDPALAHTAAVDAAIEEAKNYEPDAAKVLTTMGIEPAHITEDTDGRPTEGSSAGAAGSGKQKADAAADGDGNSGAGSKAQERAGRAPGAAPRGRQDNRQPAEPSAAVNEGSGKPQAEERADGGQGDGVAATGEASGTDGQGRGEQAGAGAGAVSATGEGAGVDSGAQGSAEPGPGADAQDDQAAQEGARPAPLTVKTLTTEQRADAMKRAADAAEKHKDLATAVQKALAAQKKAKAALADLEDKGITGRELEVARAKVASTGYGVDDAIEAAEEKGVHTGTEAILEAYVKAHNEGSLKEITNVEKTKAEKPGTVDGGPDAAGKRGAGAAGPGAGADAGQADGSAKPAADGGSAGGSVGRVAVGGGKKPRPLGKRAADGAAKRPADDTAGSSPVGESTPVQAPADGVAAGAVADAGASGNAKPAKAAADRPAAELARSGLTPEELERRAVMAAADSDTDAPAQADYVVPDGEDAATGYLVPSSLSAATLRALSGLVSRVGSLNQFLMAELGYATEADLRDALLPVQIHSVALMIDNAKRGIGAVIGDQTGVGKGRQVAAMMRWAERNGIVPVFVTQTPDLYNAMVRDLGGIKADIRPTITNHGVQVFKRGSSTDVAFSGPDTQAKRLKMFKDIANTGALPAGSNALWTNYSQLGGSDAGVAIRDAIRALPKTMLILDEAHNAAGDSAIANSIRTLSDKAQSVVYSSATYAKGEANLMAYVSTDLRHVVGPLGDDLNKMIPLAVKKGGDALLSWVAQKLAGTGQLIRRERDMTGVTQEMLDASAGRTRQHAAVSDTLSQALRGLAREERGTGSATNVMSGITPSREKFAEKLNHAVAYDSAIDIPTTLPGTDLQIAPGKDSVGSGVNIGAKLHNILGAFTMAMKADAIADQAIADVRAGKQVVIGLEFTYEAALTDLTEGLGIGSDVSGLDMADIVTRYVDAARNISVRIKDRKTPVIYRMTDEDLGPVAVASLNKMHAMARELKAHLQKDSNAALPLSPIDHIVARLKAEGIVVDELTGRAVGIDGQGKLTDLTKAGTRYDKLSRFQMEKSQVAIINASAATGVDMHAAWPDGHKSSTDPKPRVMLLPQPPLNITTYMQMLGRVDRSGQKSKPQYKYMALDMPYEKRPFAKLVKKLASLNATTSGSSKADAAGASDLSNHYGDAVVSDILANLTGDAHTHVLNMAFALPKSSPLYRIMEHRTSPIGDNSRERKAPSPAGLAEELLKKMWLLPVAAQEALAADIDARYRTRVRQAKQDGTYDLDVARFDFRATSPYPPREIIKADPDKGIFGEGVRVLTLRTKTNGYVQVIEGDLVTALGSVFPNAQGQIGQYTMEDGSVRTGFIANTLGDEHKDGKPHATRNKRVARGEVFGDAYEELTSEQQGALSQHYAGDMRRVLQDVVAVASGVRPAVARVLGKAARAAYSALKALVAAIMATASVFNASALVGSETIEARAATQSSIPPGVVSPEKLQALSDAGRIALGNILNDEGFRVGTSFFIDKPNARMWVFKDGVYHDDLPVLLGASQGDINTVASGTELSDIPVAKRITPAGRFKGQAETVDRYGKLVWLNGDAGDVAIHVIKSKVDGRRERMASADTGDNRITYGCINITEDMHEKHIAGLTEGQAATIFVVPEAAKDVGTFLPSSPRGLKARNGAGQSRVARGPLDAVRATLAPYMQSKDRARSEADIAGMLAGTDPSSIRHGGFVDAIGMRLEAALVDHKVMGIEALNGDAEAAARDKHPQAQVLADAYRGLIQEMHVWRNRADGFFNELFDRVATPVKDAVVAAIAKGVDPSQARYMGNLYAQARHVLDRTKVLEDGLVKRAAAADEAAAVIDIITTDTLAKTSVANMNSAVAMFEHALNTGVQADMVAAATALHKSLSGVRDSFAKIPAIHAKVPGVMAQVEMANAMAAQSVTSAGAFRAVSGLTDQYNFVMAMLGSKEKSLALHAEASTSLQQYKDAQNNPPTQVRGANGRMSEKLSFALPAGMRRVVAERIIAEVDAHPQAADIKVISNTIVAGFRDLAQEAVANGYADAADVARLQQQYPNYVSLMGDSQAEVDSLVGIDTGRSFIEVAEGATTVGQANLPDANLEAKIAQAANLKAQSAMRRLAAKASDTGASSIFIPHAIGKASKLNAPTIKAPGHTPTVVFINHPDAVSAMLRSPHIESPTGRWVAGITSGFGRMVTQWVMAFGPVNLVRDAGLRGFNFVGRKEINPKLVNAVRGRFFRELLNPSTWNEIWDFVWHGKASYEIAQLSTMGGLSLFTDSLVSEKTLRAELEKLNPSFWGKAKANLGRATDLVHRYNRMFELAIPLATFRALKNEGRLTSRDAAFVSADMMNFRNKGTMGPHMNAAFAFFNASAQDVKQTVRTLRSGRRAQMEFVALMATAGILYAIARGMDDDDEETGGKRMDSASDSDLAGSLMVPVFGEGNYFKVPIGYGTVRLAWVAGVRTMRVFQGVDDPADAAAFTATHIVRSLTPTGTSDISPAKDFSAWAAATFTPTLLKPVAQMAMNKDFAGNPITYPLKDNEFKSLQGRFNTPELYKDWANTLREGTGGLIDRAPEDIRHMMSQYMVGPAGALLVLADDREEKGLEVSAMRTGVTGVAATAIGANRVYRSRSEQEVLMASANRLVEKAKHLERQVNATVPKMAERESGEEFLLRAQEAGVADEELELLRVYHTYKNESQKAGRARSKLRREEHTTEDLRQEMLDSQEVMRAFVRAGSAIQ